MTFDEIKHIYDTIGPVGVKLVAHNYKCDNDVAKIIYTCPGLIPYINMSVEIWRSILAAEPQHFHLCPIVDQFDISDWAIIIGMAPELADYAPWDKMNGVCYTWILSRQPQFEYRMDFNKLMVSEWANLLEIIPAYRTDPRIKWDQFDGQQWYRLIMSHTEFHDVCDWSKLESYHWVWLLRNDQNDMYAEALRQFNALSTEHRADLIADQSDLKAYDNKTFAKKNKNEEN